MSAPTRADPAPPSCSTPRPTTSNLDALAERVSTQDKKEVRILLSWEADDDKLKQAVMTGMVDCGPDKHGKWRCTDKPGQTLLSPCKHWLKAHDTTTADASPTKAARTPKPTATTTADHTAPELAEGPQPHQPETTLVRCYSPQHPADVHRQTAFCDDPYPPTETEFVIYAGEPDRCEQDNPTAHRNPINCYFNPDANGWLCRVTADIPQSDPCPHTTPNQLDWARAAGWTPSRDTWIQDQADKISRDLDDIERRDAEAESHRTGATTHHPRRTKTKEHVPA